MRSILGACMLFSIMTTAAVATDTPALDITGLGTSGFDYTQGTYSLGWAFTANKDLIVTQLGFYDDLKNGIVGNHDVGIFDNATQALLVMTTVVPTDPLTGFFRYHMLPTPYTLTGGKTYVIEAVTLSDHYAIGPTLVIDPSITYIGYSAYGTSGSPQSTVLHFPDGTSPGANGDYGPSFLIANPGAPTNGPVISSIASNFSVAPTNTPVIFSAAATDPLGMPLTYTWNFGDGSSPLTGNPVTYAYSIEGTFTVTLTVSNGSTSTTSMLPITTVAPNSGGQGIPNIGQGDSEVIDPITLLGLSVMSSDGGVIALSIDAGNLRDTVNVSTEFDGIGTRTGGISGFNPVNKFTVPGVSVAVATATDPTSNVMKGKGRLTIAVGGAEVGLPPAITAPPKSNVISKTKLKGKFSFAVKDSLEATTLAGSDSDEVSLVGVIELPTGFDLSTGHEIDVGIGNIIDAVMVDAKGKAKLPGGGKTVSKLSIKYPHLKGTKTTAGQTATVSITLSGSNFSANGFDTEGITNNVLPSEKLLKSINRSVQLALVVGGIAYQSSAPVSFKLAKSGSSGSIGTRTGQ